MNFFKAVVRFPVLEWPCRIHHYTPRDATAFEWAGLALHDAATRHPDRSADGPLNHTLVQLFEDVLGVPDPGPLFAPALERLVRLGVLTNATGAIDLATIRPSDLTRTERGDQMLRDRLLPAELRVHEVKYVHDPVENRLLGKLPRPLPPASEVFNIAEGLFVQAFPQRQIGDALPAGEYDWWRPATRVERIEHLAPIVHWVAVDTKVSISPDRVVDVEVPASPERSEYLRGLPSDELVSKLVHPALLGTNGAASGWTEQLVSSSCSPLVHPSATFVRLPDAPAKCRWDAPLGLFRNIPEYLAPPAVPRPGSVLVEFEADVADGVSVSWNPQGTGAIVRTPAPFPAAGGLYLDAKRGHLVAAASFDLRVGGETYTMPLAFERNLTEVPPEAQTALSSLTDALAAREASDLVVAATWAEAETIWSQVFSNTKKLWFPEQLDTLLRCRQRFEALGTAKDVPGWDANVTDAWLNWLATLRLLSPTELKAEADRFSQGRVRDPECKAQAMTALLEHASVPSSFAEYTAMLQALRGFGQPLVLPFPHRLVPADLAGAFADRVVSAQGDELRPDRSALEDAFVALRKAHENLRRVLKVKTLAEVANANARQRLLRDFNASLPTVVDGWLQAWNNLASMPSLDLRALPASLLDADEAMRGLRSFLDLLASDVEPGVHEVLVLDPLVLVNTPSRVPEPRVDQLYVVPTSLDQFLAQHRSEERIRGATEAALRPLLVNPRVRKEAPNLSLIAEPLRGKPEAAPIALALRYRAYGAQVVTADPKVRNLASNEKVLQWESPLEKKERTPPAPRHGGKKGSR